MKQAFGALQFLTGCEGLPGFVVDAIGTQDLWSCVWGTGDCANAIAALSASRPPLISTHRWVPYLLQDPELLSHCAAPTTGWKELGG